MAGATANIGPTHSHDAAETFFARGGYARTNFYESHSWKESYHQLQAVSRPFVSVVWRNGAEGYEWPLDPLNNWSRVWEYPFVAEQLRRHDCEGRGLQVLDVGAAVTFFPFHLIRRGFVVTNLDSNPGMPAHFERAFDLASKALGVDARPAYVATDARDTKLPSESFDVVTCISVLEHIPGWECALVEISRLLKPGGLFILTFDVENGGPADALSAADCGQLFRLVSESMDLLTQMEDRIPPDALTPRNGQWPPRSRRNRSLLRRMWPLTSLPRKIATRMRGQRYDEICVFGGVWRKR